MRPRPSPRAIHGAIHRGAAALVLATAAAAQTAEPERVDLRVLVATVLEHPRAEDLLGFMEGRFAAAEAISIAELGFDTAEGWDVVVVDLPPGVDFEVIRAVSLPDGFDRPVVLSGGHASRLANPMGLKIDDG